MTIWAPVVSITRRSRFTMAGHHFSRSFEQRFPLPGGQPKPFPALHHSRLFKTPSMSRNRTFTVEYRTRLQLAWSEPPPPAAYIPQVPAYRIIAAEHRAACFAIVLKRMPSEEREALTHAQLLRLRRAQSL